MAVTYTKWPKNINIFHCKTLQNLPKFGFFGLKIYHLATLAQREKKRRKATFPCLTIP
jgi:hypothetical protein